MISGSEYNLSSPLSFFPHPQLQQCLNTPLGKLALNNRVIAWKMSPEKHQQRLHSESACTQFSSGHNLEFYLRTLPSHHHPFSTLETARSNTKGGIQGSSFVAFHCWVTINACNFVSK